MKFVDNTYLTVQGGDGGPGLVSFKSEANKPKLGPDGGDGGFGGNVYAVGKRALHTLAHLRFQRCYAAKAGKRGGTSHKTGADGADLDITMPLGTIIFDQHSEEKIGEILHEGQRLLLAAGGKRGLGNMRFVSSTQRAPHKHTSGGKGDRRSLRLELKLVADIGFAGFPNAGKSTLLTALSSARPKIAAYPFTTLEPHLGVVEVLNPATDVYENFIAADIPGLIEDASLGKGLGIKFLRHLERCRVIAFVLDGFSLEEASIEDTFLTLHKEMQAFNPELTQKQAVVLINKMDLQTEDFDRKKIQRFFKKWKMPVYFISAKEKTGLEDLKVSLLKWVKSITTEDQQLDTQEKQDEFFRLRPRREDYELYSPS